MASITGHFATSNGSKYLVQLCKHFAHKVDVSYEPEWGCACFPFGRAELAADDAGLTIVLACDSDESLQRAKAVIDSHLERFAFREAFVGMDWREMQAG